jgi:hypothetical protein
MTRPRPNFSRLFNFVRILLINHKFERHSSINHPKKEDGKHSAGEIERNEPNASSIMKTIIRNFVIVRNVIPTGQHAASVWPLKDYILLGTVLLTMSCANAADLVWTGGTGNWNAAGNWSPAQVPTAADNAWITNSGTYTVTVPAGTTATSGSLTVGGASGTQTLALDRATLTIGGASAINANGHLDFLVSQSVLTGAGNLTVNGTLNWANGTMSGTGTTTIGSGGVLAIGSGGVTFGRTLTNAGTGSWPAARSTSPLTAGLAARPQRPSTTRACFARLPER